MLTLGTLAFASPWILVTLLGLPVLWWLLRVTPPAPKRLRFPAIRLLLGLVPKEETPAKTPLWLIILRMVLASLVILALAHPLLNPTARLAGSGPVVLLVDDGWAAARDWPARQRAMIAAIDQAERDDRRVVLLGTAPPAGEEAARPLSILRAGEARGLAQSMTPKPWPVDRAAAQQRIEAMKLEGSVNVVWLSDGLEDGKVQEFAERLQRMGSLRFVADEPQRLAHLVTPPERETSADITVSVLRPQGGREAVTQVRATADDGRLLAREPASFADGQKRVDVRLPMPSELRNRAARVEVEGETTAGAVLLLDERWRRRPVGVLAAGPASVAQPLLTEPYYLERALAPFSEVRHGIVGDLLKRELAVVIVPDAATVAQAGDRDALQKWMEGGGVVLRFAGPQLAEHGAELLPVALRRGGRTLGGALSWEKPAPLAPFPPESPFAGLDVPKDVTVSRQVLAEPALDLASKTWARLTDGTPIVTAEQRGKGWLVLVHTTANPEWSSLALSGLFVDMLRRITGMSQGVAAAGDTVLPPLETLDAFGRLQRAPTTARAIAGGAFNEAQASAKNPPGFYGTIDAKRALNLASAVKTIGAIENLPLGVYRETYARGTEVDLRPWLLVAALALLLVDLVIAYALRGLLVFARTAAVVLACALAAPALAQGNEEFVVKATSELRLAYVRTGNAEADQTARAGLLGLTQTLQRRTAVEAADPLEVDIDTDELIFFPLLYWVVTPQQATLTPGAVERINRFLATGGSILFDTRDAGERGGFSAAAAQLRQMLRGVRVPPLQPVPPEHVLTKSFYLMQDFPGRWAGGQLWVEPTTERVNDGVSTVMIGGNDWAGAWAVDGQGRPMYAVVPGGEPQREQAFRFGVNLVMYALTGNYKSDQVHVPAILERLGQ
jgi:hypothetical protein